MCYAAKIVKGLFAIDNKLRFFVVLKPDGASFLCQKSKDACHRASKPGRQPDGYGKEFIFAS